MATSYIESQMTEKILSHILGHTLKILLEARAFIRIIPFHGDGDGPLLEATSVRKVKLQFIGKGCHLEMLVSRSP